MEYSNNPAELGADSEATETVFKGVVIPAGIALATDTEKREYVAPLRVAGCSWNEIEGTLALNRKIIGEELHNAGLIESGGSKKPKRGAKIKEPVETASYPSVLPAYESDASSQPKKKQWYEQTFRALNGSYAHMLTHLTQQTDWFVDALTRIGWSSMLIAFQSANIDPNEAFDRLEQFENPHEFVRFVNTYLQALWQAKTDAKALVKLEEQLRNQDLLLFAAGERIKQLEESFAKAVLTARTALTCMNQEDLRRFAYASALSEMQLAMLQQGVGAAEKHG